MESVDGVTSQQPRSPSPPPGHGGEEKRREEEEGGGGRGESLEQAAALEAAEQQMILIHDEYKKLLREKEVNRYISSVLHVYVVISGMCIWLQCLDDEIPCSYTLHHYITFILCGHAWNTS